MISVVIFCIASVLSFGVVSPSSGLAQEVFSPVTMDFQRRQSVTVQAHGQPPLQKTDAGFATARIQGTEQSQCQPHGRMSDAVATAEAVVEKKGLLTYTVSLNADVVAHGGHFRTCGTCLGNQCVGIHGNDTTGSSSGNASATFTIRFDPNVNKPGDYILDVGTSSSGLAPVISLSDGNGTRLSVSASGGTPPRLTGKAGAIYYLHIEMSAVAVNGGECCADSKSGKALVDVRLRKAPLLSVGYATPYIRGGNQTVGYKNVGAILLGGDMHCSGTVIGSRTVLTAAHCLSGYELDKDKFLFVLGSNYQYPDGSPSQVDAWVYPDGGDATKFKFDMANDYEDDIGLLYLKTPISVTPAALYVGTPTWQDILNNHLSLLYVGFGYNVIGDELIGLGIKRQGAWQIDHVTNKRITFSMAGRNTCHGDSGGPAFIEHNSSLLLAAITSTGNDDCTMGANTRVDAYSMWLNGKIK